MNRAGSRPPGIPWRVLLVVVPVLVVVSASGPALGIAIVSLARDLEATQSELTLISSATSVVSASVLLLAGRVADRLGRRPVLMTGLALFAVAELTTALAGDPWVVIGARVLAGFGAASVLPTSLAAIIAAFPADRRATAVSTWAATVSVSAAVAGLASGLLATTVSWRVMPLALGASALVLILLVRRLKAGDRDTSRSADVPGSVLAVGGIGTLVVAVTLAGQEDPTGPAVVVPAVLAVAFLTAFVWWELRTPNPLLPVRILARRGPQVGAVLAVLVVGAYGSYTLTGVQYLENVRGFDPLQISLLFLLGEAGVVAVSPFIPALVRRAGARVTGTVGALTVACSFGLLAWFAGAEPFWPFAATLVLLGAGFAVTVAPATTLLVTGLPSDRLDSASALNYLTRDLGGAVGTAVVSAVLFATYRGAVLTTTADLPPEVSRGVDQGFLAAAEAAGRAGPDGPALLAAAREAFVDAFVAGTLVAAAGCVVAAVVCAVFAPPAVTELREAAPIPGVEHGDGAVQASERER